MKRLTKIPRLEFNLNAIGLKAEKESTIYSIQSDNNNNIFFYDKEKFLILTFSKGYIYDTIYNIEKMCKDVLAVIEDIKVLEDEKRLGTFAGSDCRKEVRIDKAVGYR